MECLRGQGDSGRVWQAEKLLYTIVNVIDNSPYIQNKKVQGTGLYKIPISNCRPPVDKVKKLDTNSVKTWNVSTSLQGVSLFLYLSLPACLQWRPDILIIAEACPHSAEKQFHSGQIWLWHFSPGQKPAHRYSGRFPDIDTQLTHMSHLYSSSSVSFLAQIVAVNFVYYMTNMKSEWKMIKNKMFLESWSLTLSACAWVYMYVCVFWLC